MTAGVPPEPGPTLPAPPAGMAGGPGPLLRVVKDQRLAFLIVGAVNTGLGTFWFVVLQLTLGRHVGYLVVLLCAHVVSVLMAFVLYRHLVFRVRGHVWLDLARFELVNLTSLGINVALLPVAVELLGLPVIAAQILVTGVNVVISYVGHRWFSFRRRPPAATPSSTARTGPSQEEIS